MLLSYLNVPSSELFFKFAGLNHFHWHRVWDKEGNERTAEVIDKLYNPEQAEDRRRMLELQILKILNSIMNKLKI